MLVSEAAASTSEGDEFYPDECIPETRRQRDLSQTARIHASLPFQPLGKIRAQLYRAHPHTTFIFGFFDSVSRIGSSPSVEAGRDVTDALSKNPPNSALPPHPRRQLAMKAK
ncbi:hypothetical protein XA68_16530 [Ophiocordyceps unilateralis]|uniref:Uncharacterized protein n=1 Tax=Ophiocordyceps unilateralis TaxID=268505 RepID=A0A2A9P500_OPHUN|nr:hypothetical protein XA68_16530 [Ophiocordyceps unilateralis]